MARECAICLGDEDENAPLLQLPCERHYVCPTYASECLAELFRKSMGGERQFPTQCCDQVLLLGDYEEMLPFDLVWEYMQKEQEFSVHAKSRRYCANASCGNFLHPETHETDANVKYAKCNACSTITCTGCKAMISNSSGLEKCANNLSTFSDGGEDVCYRQCQNEKGKRCDHCVCVVVKALVEHKCEPSEEDQAFKKTAQEKGYQECLGCGVTAELKEACNHISCECGVDFCYICGRGLERGICPHGCPLYGRAEYDEEGYNQDGFHKETGLNRGGLTRRDWDRQHHGDEDEDNDGDDRDEDEEDELAWIGPDFREILAMMDPEDRFAAIEQARIHAAETGEIALGGDEADDNEENEEEDDEEGEDEDEDEEDEGEGEGEEHDDEQMEDEIVVVPAGGDTINEEQGEEETAVIPAIGTFINDDLTTEDDVYSLALEELLRVEDAPDVDNGPHSEAGSEALTPVDQDQLTNTRPAHSADPINIEDQDDMGIRSDGDKTPKFETNNPASPSSLEQGQQTDLSR